MIFFPFIHLTWGEHVKRHTDSNPSTRPNTGPSRSDTAKLHTALHETVFS